MTESDKEDNFKDMFQAPISNLGSSLPGFVCMPEVYALKNTLQYSQPSNRKGFLLYLETVIPELFFI